MKPIKVISVTGGKGGVGKTSISVNLAIALAKMGKKVMILDADMGLANIDVLLGIRPGKNLSHVMSGECELKDILIEGPLGIKVVPASSGAQKMTEMSMQENAGLIGAFSELSDDVDVLLVDTAAGISSMVVSFTQASQDILFVVCDEPTSIADTYALMKILSTQYHVQRFRVVANMVRSDREGKHIFQKLTQVTDRFLDVSLDFCGMIPFDDNIRIAIKKQKPLLLMAPRSPAAVELTRLANAVKQWQIPEYNKGNIEFFMERLIESAV